MNYHVRMQSGMSRFNVKLAANWNWKLAVTFLLLLGAGSLYFEHSSAPGGQRVSPKLLQIEKERQATLTTRNDQLGTSTVRRNSYTR
jgi:hypothetical protein